MPEFEYPLSHEDRCRAIDHLRSGWSCAVGEYRLYGDKDGTVETQNAYGSPAIFTQDTAPEDSLKWVDDQYAHEAAERAEYEAYLALRRTEK